MVQGISLDGDWDLWFFPEGEHAIKAPSALPSSGARRVPARVPGNVELDLQRAGLLPDPFVGANIYKLAAYEKHEWWYVRRFSAPSTPAGTRARLLFHGLDCFATVWLNGQEIGSARNMFVTHAFDVTGRLRAENEIAVRIGSPILAARQFNYPASCFAMATNHEQLWVRKAAHGYGWDITPRAVSAGIWRSVELEVSDPARIGELYYYTKEIDASSRGGPNRPADAEGKGVADKVPDAVLGLHWQVALPERDLDGFVLRISGSSGESAFSQEIPLRFTAGNTEIRVPAARLWWPRGYGDASLYRLTAELLRNGTVLDRRQDTIGLRQIELRRTELTTSSEPGEFLFRCNGQPILCKGTNWVPLDAFHSRDAERYALALPLMQVAGCNIVRCWGGNVYEDHRFFDFCDEAGILVWQDFAFACALYPQEESFYAEIREEARAVIRKLRNHASLALWAGDNEIDIFAVFLNRDPEANAISRRVLPAICASEDPYRPYLPSSPYVSPEAFRRGAADQKLMPEQHLWGPRDYYKSRFYAESTAHFASEIGYHGCPNVSSVERFVDAEHRWPWKGNDQWRVHAADQVPEGGPYRHRIKLMADQVRELFGEEPSTLEDFALASQVSQAEAKKFFIEMTRLARWRRTGIIWWNLLDCWPQFSDAVVDYYLGRKLAFWYIKRAQAPVHLMVAEPEDWRCRLVMGNDTLREVEGEFHVREPGSDAALVEGRFRVPANANAQIGTIPVSHSEHRLFLLRWSTGGREQGSHYLLGKPPFSLDWYRALLPSIAALPDGFDAAAVAR